jgi:hypothetical protein
MEEPLTEWLEEVVSTTSAGSGQLADLSLWLPQGGSYPARLSALIGNGRFPIMPDTHHLDLQVCGPLMTSHVRRFTADTGHGGEAVIPLPDPDFLLRRTSWTDLGMVAADVDVWSESNDPVGEVGSWSRQPVALLLICGVSSRSPGRGRGAALSRSACPRRPSP